MDNKSDKPCAIDNTVVDEAAQWFKRLSDKNVSPGDWHGFEQWLAQDNANKTAYDEFSAIWNNPHFDAVLLDASEDSAWLARMSAQTNVVSPGFGDRKKRVAFAVAASVLLATVIGLFLFDRELSKPQEWAYQTDVGERQDVVLADGSEITLNTDTRLVVTYSGEVRSVHLPRGEAYFRVAPEGRPFQVTGGSGLVTVLGTAFEVKVSPAQMVVSVDSGRVAVGPENIGQSDAASTRIELTANQRVAVTDQQLGSLQQTTNGVADWLDGWLEFNDMSLVQVTEELDRYYVGDIRLARPELWQLRVTGRFDLSDVERALKILAKSMKLGIRTSGAREIIIGEI